MKPNASLRKATAAFASRYRSVGQMVGVAPLPAMTITLPFDVTWISVWQGV